MNEDERIVRHHLRPAPWAEEALDRLLSATRAEGYARAREQAEIVAEASRAEAEALIAAGTTPDGMGTLEAEMATAEEIRDDIRAMRDGVAEKECEGVPDCGWHNGGPCDPCKAKVSP